MKKRTLFLFILLIGALALFSAAAESEAAGAAGNQAAPNAREVYRTPDPLKGEIDEKTARQLAQKELAKVDIAASRYPAVHAVFYAPPEKPGEAQWDILFEAPVGLNDYTVCLDAKGALIRLNRSELTTLYDGDGRFIADILPARDDVFPAAADISAHRASEAAVAAYNQTMEQSLKAEDMSVTGGLKELNGRRFWFLRLTEGPLPRDGGLYLFDVVVDAKTGEVLYSPEREAFAWRTQERGRGIKLYAQFEQDGHFLTWPLAKQKEMWPDLLALPEEGDLSQEEARAIARETLQREAELSDRFFDRYQAFFMFENHSGAAGGRAWHVAFALPEDLPRGSLAGTQIFGFNVWVDATTGQTLSFSTPKEMTFAAHFYQYDDGTAMGFAALDAADNIASGLPCPATGFAITKGRAEDIARDALSQAFPKLRVQDYAATTTHVLQNMREYFVVTLDNGEGDTLFVALQNNGDVAAYSQPTATTEQAGDVIHWPLSPEEKAALMPDFYGTPQEGELTEKEAIDIAVQTLKKHYALTDADIAQLVPFAGINLYTTRRWEINFFPKDQVENGQYSDSYWVDIDIVTGDPLSYQSPSESNG